MAIVSGIDGKVVFADLDLVVDDSGGTPSVNEHNVTAWTLSFDVEAVEITALSHAWRSYQYGVLGYSGSFDLLFDTTPWVDYTDLNIGANATTNAAAPSTAEFVFDIGSVEDGAISGSVYITGLTFNVGTENGPSTVTVEFVGATNSAPTFSTAA